MTCAKFDLAPNLPGTPVYIQLKSKLPAHWNLIGDSMTAPPPLLSPSNILQPHSSHCAFNPLRENPERISKMLLFDFFLLL
jgi:hypothetical protein